MNLQRRKQPLRLLQWLCLQQNKYRYQQMHPATLQSYQQMYRWRIYYIL
ncbi:hypothetical protein Y788_15105 [Pantoea dispersa 625]|nr:hypothetical protein Y788_15105 [Pantoea dispersa 625]